MHRRPEEPESFPAVARAEIPQLSLVLPAFNESAAIVRVVEEARDELALRCEHFEILVVDDGSTDATPRLLAELSERLPELRVLTQPRNLGYAAALARGLSSARFDPVLYTDADGQFELADLDRAMPLLLAGADMVAGYRAQRADPWLRRFASAGFNSLVRATIGIRARDIDCAFKLFRRSFIEKVPLESDGFLVDTEIYARGERAEMKIAQLPVRHRPRLAGRSTVRPSAVWRSTLGLFALQRALRAEARESQQGRPADTAPRAADAGSSGSLSGGFWGLALGPLLALTLALFLQGGRPLFEPDEGRTVQVAMTMIDSGDWSIPRLRGEPYLDKPPMVYWLVAGGMELFGHNEFAARLPHALAFAVTAAAVAWLGSMLWGVAVGRASGVAYAISLAPFTASNVLTPDTLLALAGALVAALVWRADRGGEKRFWLAAGAAAGAGLMIKGVALLVIVAPLFLALSLRHRGVGWLRAPGPWLAAALAAIVGLPWYLWIARELPGAADYFVSNQITGRLLDDRYDRNSQWSKVFTLYAPVLLLGSLPWSLLGLRRLLAKGWRALSWGFDRSAESLYVSLSITVPILVFSLASSRMPLYLLPVFAPIALVAGRAITQGAGRLPYRVPALAAVWIVALFALKGVAVTTPQPHRDGRFKAELVSAALRAEEVPVFVSDADLDSLGFYGVEQVRWASTRLEQYPVFRASSPLDEELERETSPAVLLATVRHRLEPTRSVAASSGYLCEERPGDDRLALLACRRDLVRVASPRADAEIAADRPSRSETKSLSSGPSQLPTTVADRD